METLEQLLDPITPEVFFNEYYEKKPLYIPANPETERYAKFPDFEGFEKILWANELKLKESLRVNRKGNYRQLPHRSNGKDVFRWAIDSFSEGYTLILNGTDNICYEIAALTRAVEDATYAKVAANIFLTPSENRGFMPHFDTHDVFILQFDGVKHWNLYDQRVDLPVDRQIYLLDQSTVGDPTHQYRLSKGDFLYVPRGLVHGAYTEEEHSLHLTMGYRPLRWFDYLHSLIDVIAEDDASFRKSMMDYENLGRELDSILDLLHQKSSSIRLRAEASSRSKEKFVSQLKALPGNHISMTDFSKVIDSESLFQRRPEAICNVFEKRNSVLIQFPGIGLATEDDLQPGSIEAPLSAGGIFRYISNRKEPFSIADLPGIFDMDSKISIVRKLLHEGLLIRAK